MKRTITIIFLNMFCGIIFAQQADFEGIIFYKNDLKSKTEIISEKALRNIIGIGIEDMVFIKHGNYRTVNDRSNYYYITKDQKAYIKFKGVDTLYYLDYLSDTTVVTSVSKSDEKRNIAGFECKLLTIQLGSTTKKYYYAPSLYMNPEYDKNNKIDRYDVFAKETSSLYLSSYDESKTFSLSRFFTSVQQTPVNDSVFELPKLPQTRFVY